MEILDPTTEAMAQSIAYAPRPDRKTSCRERV